MNRRHLLFFNVCSALTGLVLLHCGDDDASPSVTPSPDGHAPDVSPGPSDAQLDTNVDLPPTKNVHLWRPTVIAADLQPHGVDNVHVPLVIVQNQSQMPARPPDGYIDSKAFGGVGFGCLGYKFSPASPYDPKGPRLSDGDMGVVTLNGFTGGTYLLNPSHPPIPKPITCKRAEIAPDSGVFNYGCDSNPDVNGPSDGFLKPTDMVSVNVAGGAAVPAWSSTTGVSPNDSLVVKTDLNNITPAMVDGSQDLTLEYSCGDGGTCGMAAFVVVNILTSDGRDQDAAPTPGPFPMPKNEFGLVQCVDLLYAHANSFVVPKEILALLPTSWTDLRTVIFTVAAQSGEVDVPIDASAPAGQPTLAAAGFGRVGVTSKR